VQPPEAGVGAPVYLESVEGLPAAMRSGNALTQPGISPSKTDNAETKPSGGV